MDGREETITMQRAKARVSVGLHISRLWLIGLALGIWVSALGPSSAQTGLPKPLSIDEMMQKPVFRMARLSPSGRYFVAIVERDLKEHIMFFDVAGDGQPIASVGMGDSIVNWVNWVNEDRVLLSFASYRDKFGNMVNYDDLDEVRAARTNRLLLVNRDGSNPHRLFSGDRQMERYRSTWGIADRLHNDPDHILIPALNQGDVDLFKVNVNTGAYEVLMEGSYDTVDWKTDGNGRVIFRYDNADTGSGYDVYARDDQPDGKIKWRRIKKIRFKSERNNEADDFALIAAGPTSSTYYVSARPEGADTAAIYLYDFNTDEYVETLFRHDKIDITSVIYEPTSREYLGTFFVEDKL
ncbi:MAG: hypothetical protein AAGF15_01240, partial [Pseudomonadota bacterium]